MANFSFVFSPVNVDAGGNSWVDPAGTLPSVYGAPALSIPTRQNARDGLPHRYTRFYQFQKIDLVMLPAGSSTLVFDTSLGGNLFQAWFAEVPYGAAAWSSIAGVSAYQFFTPTIKGAYLAVLSRPTAGGILWHFTVE